MPALSVWAVRLSLLHFAVGRLLGALLLLNVGVGLVAAAAVHGFTVLATLGRLCEAGALAAFAFHAWPRVRAAQRHA